MAETARFEMGDMRLQSGETLHDAVLSYETHGTLSASADNAIVLPTFYGGRSSDYRAMIGPGKALDPARWFIVVPDMFGNGLSSSPSNQPAPFDGPNFPRITHWDNVAAQHRLVTEVLGVRRLALVAGFSMGGQQANQWAAQFPDMVARCAPWCGGARTTGHTWAFLEGPKAALRADAAYAGGWYDSPPRRGLRAFGRAWAAWGSSAGFYRDGLYEALGHSSAQDHVTGFWEGNFLSFDANDLLAKMDTWQSADISANPLYGGDYAAACAAIRARTLLIPGATDQYFPVEDNRIQAERMTAPVELRPIPSDWGHIAGAPGLNAPDTAFLDAALAELLATPATSGAP